MKTASVIFFMENVEITIVGHFNFAETSENDVMRLWIYTLAAPRQLPLPPLVNIELNTSNRFRSKYYWRVCEGVFNLGA